MFRNKILLWIVWGLILAAAVVQTRNSGANAASGSPTVNMPSGLAEGDLVLCFFTSDGSGTHTWPSGTDDTFVQIFTQLADSSAARHSVAWHEVTATGPGASITMGIGAVVKSTYSIYRISGHEDPDTQAPEVVASVATGTSAAPDAANCAPTGGSKDYLWITAYGSDGRQLTPTIPTNYTTLNGAGNGGGSPCTTWSGEYANTAASEDAAAWATGGSSEQWVAATIAVHPGAAATPATDLYGLKAVIKTDGTDLYGLQGQVKTDGTDDYGLKAVVTSVTDATDLYGLKAKPHDSTFPLVESYALSVESTDTTTHTVDAPDGTVSGDLLLLISGCDGASPSITPPTGFTQLQQQITGSGTINISYKLAGGSEPGSYTVGTSASEESAHIIYRISGAQDPSFQAPEISAAALSADSNPDPNSLTPTGGAKNYLWLAAFWNADDATGTATPANYSNFLNNNSGGADPTNIGAAEYTNNAASEDPGAFTISAAKLWSAWTIAIHPPSDQYGLKARVYDSTFPFVETTATSSETSNTTSHDVDMPSGIVSGDLLIIDFAVDTDEAITWPNGANDDFTEFFNLNNSGFVRLACAYRWANGSEPASVTVTTATLEKSSHTAYRISGAENPSTQVPEASTGATGTSVNPDPGTVTPTGGAKNYLWLAVTGNQKGPTTDTLPSGYSNKLSIESGTGITNVGVGTGERTNNASSENPAPFTISDAFPWVACTIAVHPPAPGATPATDLFGLKAVIKTDGTDLYGLKGVVKTDGTDLYGLKGVVKTDGTDLYGLKGQVKTDGTDLYGLKGQVKTDGTDLYGLKGQVKTDGTDLYGLKSHVHIDAQDDYGLKANVKTDGIDLYGLKAVVAAGTPATDLYGLQANIKTDGTDLFGLKAIIIAATEATDLYGLKAQVKTDATNLYGLKGRVKTDGTDLYGLKGVVKTDGTDLYGLKGVVKTDGTDLYGLKVFIFLTATDLYGLKAIVKKDATELYGLQATIKDDATDLYGLKVHIHVDATDLYGLKALVKSVATDLYGLQAIIKTDATDLYGLKAAIRSGVWAEKTISATSSTEKTITPVSWTEKVV